MSSESLEAAKVQYQTGKAAFERGQYRQSVQSLEKAASLIERNTAFGGEVQIWLITAYEATGQREEAIALCEKISRHPDYETRKQGKRLLYILKAPLLRTRPEWLTKIPDLTALDESERSKGSTNYPAPAKPPARLQPQPISEPIDLSQVNTQDNGFVWVALVAIALTLGSLLWFS